MRVSVSSFSWPTHGEVATNKNTATGQLHRAATLELTKIMKDIVIKPARNLVGSIRLPGDKSISHRYAMLAALAQGTTRLRNFSSGADCASTLGCLRSLEIEIVRANGEVTITGRGGELSAPRTALDCGNSGSTMRMLSGILAGQPFATEMIGDAS